MNKLSSIALSAALLVAGVAGSAAAEARPYVEVGYPGGAVVETVGYRRPYLDAHDRYRHYQSYLDRHDRFRHERWNRRW
jgi:hypothetical protein